MVVYYPKAEKVIINGDTVIQSQRFSGWVGESVFHQALGGKKYTVAADIITQLCS